MKATRIVLFVAATAITIVTLDDTRAGDREAIQRQVLARDELFNQAVATRDFDLFSSLIAENAVFLGGGLTQGREAIVAAWSPLFAADRQTTLTWQPHTVEVAASRDLAYTLGDFELRSSRPEGAEKVMHGTYVSIWKQQGDGSWKVVVDAGTPPQERP